MLDERVLQRLAGARSRRALDGDDLPALGMRGGHEAGVDSNAVDQNRACAALAFSTSLFRARQTAILSQHIEQPFHRMRFDGSRATVDDDLHQPSAFSRRPAAKSRSGVAGIERTSKPQCRSALITAGAGPSIGISPTPLAPNGP